METKINYKLKKTKIMKKLFLSLAVIISCVTMANAQSTFGVRAGFNYSTFNVSVENLSVNANPGYKPGFYLGYVGEIGLGGKFGLQYELNYVNGGTKVWAKEDFLKDVVEADDWSGVAGGKYTTHNITVPFMLKYNSDNLSFMVGPYVSYNVAGKVSLNKNTDSNIKDMIEQNIREDYTDPRSDEANEEVAEALGYYDSMLKYASKVVNSNILKLDVGLACGVEYKFANNMFIEARYNIGLMNFLKDEVSLPYPDDERINGSATQSEWEADMSPIVLKDELGVNPTLKNQFVQVGIGFRF